MRVRLPCLPLHERICASMVKRIITSRFEREIPGSSPGRGIWCLWCSGFCTAGCEPEGGGSTPLRHPSERSTIERGPGLYRVHKTKSTDCSLVTCARMDRSRDQYCVSFRNEDIAKVHELACMRGVTALGHH